MKILLLYLQLLLVAHLANAGPIPLLSITLNKFETIESLLHNAERQLYQEDIEGANLTLDGVQASAKLSKVALPHLYYKLRHQIKTGLRDGLHRIWTKPKKNTINV